MAPQVVETTYRVTSEPLVGLEGVSAQVKSHVGQTSQQGTAYLCDLFPRTSGKRESQLDHPLPGL